MRAPGRCENPQPRTLRHGAFGGSAPAALQPSAAQKVGCEQKKDRLRFFAVFSGIPDVVGFKLLVNPNGIESFSPGLARFRGPTLGDGI